MPKVIVIGLDGATWDNLIPWIDKGELPFFKKIIDEGVHTKNITTIPCMTCPAIPSFYTGKSPVKTKVFGFRKPNGRIISSNDVKSERFWDTMGKKGISSAIVNLRITYPPKIMKGTMVSSMMTPTPESEFVYPKEEKRHFKSFMDKKLDKWDITKIGGKDRNELLKLLLEDDFDRFDKFKRYTKEKKFDFELFYFGCTDVIQHRLWGNQDLILKGYKAIEDKIKGYLSNRKDADVIMFSDHGFGESPKNTFYVDNWLAKEGLLSYKNPVIKNAAALFNKIYYFFGYRLFKILPPKYYNKLYSMLHRNKDNGARIMIDPIKTNMSYINRKKTKAFLSQAWGITIIKDNVKDYKSFRENLIGKLEKIKDNQGNRIFKDIHKKEYVYPGSEKYKQIPDIIFILDEKFEIKSGPSREMAKKIAKGARVEGSHDSKREGIFIAFGPDIKRGKIDSIRIYDIAPTIMHIYGVPIPKDMDGKVLKEIFNEESKISKRKIIHQEEKEDLKKFFKSINI